MTDWITIAEAQAHLGQWSQVSQTLQHWLLDTEGKPPKLGIMRVLPLVLATLEEGEFQERWDIVRLLPVLGEGAIAPLIALAENDDTDLEARWFAIRALSGFNHPTVIATLLRILQSHTDEELSTEAAAALATIGTPAIETLATLLSAPETRWLAVRALAQIRHSATIVPLLSVVQDADPAVRERAIDALGSFHDDRIPPVLLHALTDPVAAVRKVALAGLGMRSDLLGHLDLVTPVTDRLWDLNLEVCQQAAVTLGRLGTDPAASALFRALKSPHTPEPLQREIIRALGWIGSALALEHLQTTLSLLAGSSGADSLYREIVAVIGQWADPSLKPLAGEILIALLQADPLPVRSRPVKQAIALALGQLGQPQALDVLIQVLTEEDLSLRLHAIAALKALDAQQAYQRLQALSTNSTAPDPLRRGVAIALQEWGLSG